ncbi:hypothetical protein ACG7TL_009154 [Trametes sanguinea]
MREAVCIPSTSRAIQSPQQADSFQVCTEAAAVRDGISLPTCILHEATGTPLTPLHGTLQMGSIIVINNSGSPISVFVSKYSNSDGSDAWFTLQPGGRDSWSRKGWELVAFKNAKDSNRTGVYVPADSTVTFDDMAHVSVV